MAKNPLFCKRFFKTERRSACRPQNLYANIIEGMMCQYGTVIQYFPVSEYSLTGPTSLWGEDVDKKYLEKYTLTAFTEGENDNFQFNNFGIDKTTAERIIYVSKKMFREIVGREDPLPDDHFCWTQNNIVYQVTDVTDQEAIILGDELYWILTGTPRWVEGETYGTDDCDSSKDPVIDPDICDPNDSSVNEDGNVLDDPDIHIPGPTKHKDDRGNIEDEDPDIIIRDTWGNWGK